MPKNCFVDQIKKISQENLKRHEIQIVEKAKKSKGKLSKILKAILMICFFQLFPSVLAQKTSIVKRLLDENSNQKLLEMMKDESIRVKK